MGGPKTIEEIEQYLNAERQNGATIIQPSSLTPVSYYRPVVETIYLSKDDYYESQKRFRISFSGLTKLGNAAGVEWDPVHTCRTDSRNDKMYVAFRAVGGIRKNDGKLYPVKAEYDLDLDIIEEEIRESYMQKRTNNYNKNKTDKEFMEYAEFCIKRDFMQKRKRKLTLAESGAKARVLRSLLDIPNQYANESQILGMPFIVVRFILDHQNPDIRNLFLDTARQSMLGLYGGGAAPVYPRAITDTDIHSAIDVPTVEPEDSMDEATSLEVDFMNLRVEEQVGILKEMCLKTGYNLDAFIKKAGKTPEQLTDQKRMEFLRHLNTLKEVA